ncbi:hypothetical protein [Methylobacterium sp. NFXW15]
MTIEELKTALEVLIVEAKAKGPGKIPTDEVRDAVLKVSIRDRYGR